MRTECASVDSLGVGATGGSTQRKGALMEGDPAVAQMLAPRKPRDFGTYLAPDIPGKARSALSPYSPVWGCGHVIVVGR